MKRKKTLWLCFGLMAACVLWTMVSCSPPAGESLSDIGTQLLDRGWKFKKGELNGAEQPGYDDSQWRTLSIPHDWQIEPCELQDENHIGPFVKGIKDSTSTGNVEGGIGWYRKHLYVDGDDIGKSVYIVFDGVSVQSDVWINGTHLGFHPNGYTQFFYPLTPHLVVGDNVLAVRSVNTGDNTRWYAGGGIYREAWLSIGRGVHIEPQSLFVTTPAVSRSEATVNLSVGLHNSDALGTETRVTASIYTDEGRFVDSVSMQQGCQPQSGSTVDLPIRLKNPALWSVDTPALYSAEVKVYEGGRLTDRKQTRFGIRSIGFSAEEGFLLNGQKRLLKGACMHHDNGLLGAAAFRKAEYRKVEILKRNGFNAIRTSHNPPSTALLDACDELGMLVIDEAFDMWFDPKRPNDYNLYFAEWSERDLTSLVCRDRNHPSVIVWSIGNEIFERADLIGLKTARRLKQIVRDHDTTRPVTQAICALWQVKTQEWDATIPAFEILDVCGYNYEMDHYERDHRLFPQRVMIGTETHPRSAYENWRHAVEKPYVLGDFVWTGMDYIGEVGIGNTLYGDPSVKKGTPVRPWPWYLSFCGDIDLLGAKKPQSYYRDVVWGNSRLEMLVHTPVPEGKAEIISAWGWPDQTAGWELPGDEGKTVEVSVFSDCKTVRLLLNNRLVGEKQIGPRDRMTAVFQLPYEPGELKALALNGGNTVSERTWVTPDKPTALRLIPETPATTPHPNDIVYVRVELIDGAGKVVTAADTGITLTVEGQGALLGSGNASPDDLRSFGNRECRSWRGKCMAILRPTGKPGTITLRASAQGLTEAVTVIDVK